MYNITCNTDDNYAQHCTAMLCSLFENNKDEEITVHVLCGNLSETNRQLIKDLSVRYQQQVLFHAVDESVLDGVQFRSKRPLTKAAYYRLLLSSILRDVDKVLYLDCDMIVLGKIKELFDIELDNYALAAVLDPMPYNNQHQMQLNLSTETHTFCSGIMLVNLEYWRKKNIESQLLEFAKRKREPVYLHDQDVLNYVLKDHWFMLPPKWNHNPVGIQYSPLFRSYHFADSAFCPAVIHYCSEIFKPWYKAPCPGSKYYKRYLKLSNYPAPRYVTLPVRRHLYCYYKYIHRMAMKYKPLMPRIIVLLIEDMFNLLRLIWYMCIALSGKKERFVRLMSNFFIGNRINF